MPRTLAQNAQYIAETIKPAIKSAIEAQGVTVPSTDSFLDYADRIGEIEGGGSGYQLKDLPTGSISTVSDAAPLPLNALKVSVEAVQDLHGYDHPWVGGAGKNKCDNSTNIVGYYTGQGYYISSNDHRSSALIEVKPNAEYIASIFDSTFQRIASLVYTEWDANANFILQTSGTSVITTSPNTKYIRVRNYNAQYTLVNTDNYFYQLEEGSTATTYAPYSNICPISGWDVANVSDVDDVDNPTVTQTTTIALGQTVYGGEVDVVNGELKITDGYIASYNGETLPSTWISSMDVYAEGTTPTTGSEVCYKLAEPIIINLTPSLIKSLNGTNNLSVDCGEVIEGEYFVDEGAIDVRKVDYQIGSSGSIKTTDGRVLSGFASMNGYHARPLDASGNWLDVDWSKSFEIGVAFKMTDYPNSNASQYIFGNGTNDLGYRFRTPRVYFSDYWQSLLLDMSLDGSSWYMDASVNFKPALDTWYFIRLKFDLSTLRITLDITTDFETYTTLHTEVLSSGLYHNGSAIGIGGDQPTASDSTTDSFMVDTFNTYIKGDGVSWGASTGAFPS